MSSRDLTAEGTEAPPRWPLSVARIVIGLLWFSQLLWKLPPDFGCGPQRSQGLCDWIGREIQHPAIPLYAAFLRGVVVPSFGLFAWATVLVEAAIAVSLIVGFLSRLGGLLGLLQSLNLLVGLAAVPSEWYWSYVMLAVLCALFWLLAPGRVWGVDGLVRARFIRAAAGGSAVARAAVLAS